MKPRTPNHVNLVICYQIIDLTYVRLGSGFIYLIVIMDVFLLALSEAGASVNSWILA
jgi:hypothetical protein